MEVEWDHDEQQPLFFADGYDGLTLQQSIAYAEAIRAAVDVVEGGQ